MSNARTATRTGRGLTAITIAALLVGILPAAGVAQEEADPRAGLAPGTDVAGGTSATFNPYSVPNADAETAEQYLELLANRPKPPWFTAAGAFNYNNIISDLAFTGDYAFSGNYRGFGIYDVSDPTDPELVTHVNCPGGQGDVSVYGNLLFVSVESTAGRVDCSTNTASTVFRGVRIFDISDVLNPQHVGGVQTCRGSHTHTVVEDPDDPDNVYVYVSGTAGVRSAIQLAGCTNTPSNNNPDSYLDADGDPILTSRFLVEVIKVPLDAPGDAAVVKEARLMADPVTGNPHGLWAGGNHGPGTQSTTATHACHDITAYPEIGLAAGACQGNGILIDISDPANPVRLDEVLDPNFAFWHSATFNNDGTKVVFTDEWGGGVGARCRALNPSTGLPDPDNWGANAIFDIVEGKLQHASYYKVPNVQATNETCVAHNGSLVPVPGRDVMVQAWYEGGVSVFDFTDSADPVEIAFFDRGPYAPAPTFHQGGYWSAYWYNGQVYGNEIFLGFDSFGLTASDQLSANELEATRAVTFDEFNAQAQSRVSWAPSFALSRAYLDQLVRADSISTEDQEQVTKFLDRAERFTSGPQRIAALSSLRALAYQLRDANQATLAGSLRALADELS